MSPKSDYAKVLSHTARTLRVLESPQTRYTLARELGLHHRTVYTFLQTLIRVGWVTRLPQPPGRPTLYRATVTIRRRR